MIFQVTNLYAQSVKPAWYRYYDSRGIANISTNVTPNHIRYGYEALDQNMQVIQRNRAYNSEADIKQAPQRAALAKKNEADLKLKKPTATVKWRCKNAMMLCYILKNRSPFSKNN